MKSFSKLILVGMLLIGTQVYAQKNAFKLTSGSPIKIAYDASAEATATTNALQLLVNDMEAVLSVKPTISTERKADILIGTIGKNPAIQKLIDSKQISVLEIENKGDAFVLSVVNIDKKPTLVVVGSDRRGTAYGLLEISRLMGVSPWEWWADVNPKPLKEFTLAGNFRSVQSPSVPYRGIFLNDEDWGLMPWSTNNYEQGLSVIGKAKGTIGPKTYERIFQLLLRLRANTIWPAMHECTVSFALQKGNMQMADDYAIFVGGSHCEPMMRSVAGEWPVEGVGDYNYVSNRDNVYRFFEKRVAEVVHMDNIYTLGIRGEHDGQMQGAKTYEEQKDVLTRVFEDQRHLLKQYVNTDLTKIPQVFIPYKEVLDVYNKGLDVADDVTLMWCDDNYGYIKHFPTDDELKRKGGHGVYYHISYWGRPHDYLWLGTASPGLLYQQMKLAYEKGIQKIWILNVGDIKPSEYQIELFLDMAWNFDGITAEGVTAHLKTYLQREFGNETGAQLLPVMQEHYRLAYIRKPEFMGNTREEERSNPLSRVVKDLPWSENEIQKRLQSYNKISNEVENISKKIPLRLQNAYFELIKYPVQGATQMNVKMLSAQLARHGKSEWKISDTAYDSIVSLTKTYNSLANGKWNYMMDYQPRKLPPFDKVTHGTAITPLTAYKAPLFSFNGTQFTQSSGKLNIAHGLGYDNKVLEMTQGSTVSFALKNVQTDSITVEVRLLPNHPVNGKKLRLEISLDNATAKVVDYETYGRSEEWKQNVLRNQAICRVKLPVNKKSSMLTIKAVDKGVVLDELIVYDK